jgi:hypothetical protein
MILGILAIALVALIGYVWVTRGFFSALIHLVCTLLAGGVAFGVWEPVAKMLLDAAPTSGFLSFLEGSAYGLGLALPFAVCLAIFRVIADVILRANVKVTPVADYVGGGLCGVLAGIPTVGIMLISLGFLRLDTELLGYQPMDYTSKGMIEKKKSTGMILPIDEWTASLYGHVSKASFSTETPLATYYPDLALVPHTLRINNGDGAARNVFKASDYKVVARYTVGKDKNLDPSILFGDMWNTAPQAVTDVDGNTLGAGSYIEGYVVRFNSGAKERGGDNKVVFGAAQMRLLCANSEQTQFKTCYAIAAAAQADSASPAFARFRFDTKGLFFASVGGTSESSFAIEFAVPAGYTPIALYLKNSRHLIDDPATAKPKIAFETPMARDAGIVSGDLVRGTQIDVLDTGNAKLVEAPRAEGFNTGVRLPTGMTITNNVGRTLHKTTIRTMRVEDEGNLIVEGDQTFTEQELREPPLEKTLRVEKFAIGSDVVMVQLDVSIGSQFSWMGAAAQSIDDTQAPVLMDTNNQTYEPVGWIYVDATKSNQTQYRYMPITPVRALNEKGFPVLSRSAPDNKLKLLFLVNKGAKINRFAVGGTVIAELKTPVQAGGN